MASKKPSLHPGIVCKSVPLLSVRSNWTNGGQISTGGSGFFPNGQWITLTGAGQSGRFLQCKKTTGTMENEDPILGSQLFDAMENPLFRATRIPSNNHSRSQASHVSCTHLLKEPPGFLQPPACPRKHRLVLLFVAFQLVGCSSLWENCGDNSKGSTYTELYHY